MLKNYFLLIVVSIISISAGIIVEKLILPRLIKRVEKSPFKTDDIIIRSFKGMFIFWFSFSGMYFSLLWLFRDKSWMDNITKIFVSFIIVSVTIVIARILVGLVNNIGNKSEGFLPSISIFSNLTRLLLFIIGVLVLLQYLGISITPILTALGVGGLAVALALQDTLSNIFAGIHILISRNIKPGDFVRLDSGEEGFVIDISWRYTSIRMMSNNAVFIPNSKLSNSIVTNHELPEKEMSLSVNVGVSYSSDLENVEKVACRAAKEVMKEVAGGVPEFEPFIRYHTFSDFSIDFSVILRVKSFSDQYLVRHEFIKRLHKCFRDEGIEIPHASRYVHIKE